MAERGLLFCDTPEALADALHACLPRPTAVVGVGNALRGDDAFGPEVVAALAASENLRPFDVQAVPESFLMPIIESGCGGVLFADAADIGAEPGRVAFVPAERLAEVDVSTHTIALGLVAEAIKGLARQTAGRQIVCALVGAQPEDLKTPDRLSPAMRKAVRLTAAGIQAFAAR